MSNTTAAPVTVTVAQNLTGAVAAAAATLPVQLPPGGNISAPQPDIVNTEGWDFLLC
jgi:hypothetical protein